ncbi:Beta-barrel assembly machine subunit BamA [Methylomagnum ishizawai]|uniref:Outer membrane protein assembly factor BamA n=1 Tax=Methylomagnum ishizawai TaxID=1760988 RepID=A0A1Y6D779_9GAMM|nr:Beta-barrel assembly machine subunit BamA [Methylomagnum ishizawai]
MKRFLKTHLAGLMLLTTVSTQGMDSFIIEDIRVEGLQRVAPGTVFNYLPVKVGDSFDQRLAAESIKALFKTGFFKDVKLEQDGDTLLILVEERASISSVKLEGNKDIGTDDLKKALKGVGLSEGKVFDRAILDKVEQELRRQYYSRGKYGLKITSTVEELPRNRVEVVIKISEGKVAKIKQINIVGNSVFSDEELLDAFELSTGNLLSFYTKNDQYSKQKLGADLERLRSYYLDRGHINFQIESTQVAITPDKKEIYITVNVKEGEVYKVSDVKLTGKLIVPPQELTPLVQIGPADTFSRKLATETSKAISDRLGDEGYIFANVNMVPEVDEATKTVAITFFVDPGKQVYVRRINFRGNTKTRDEVLRREMRQMEAAWASSTKIERSKTRLERLGYFQETNVESPAVPGTTDQIDVNYNVTEKPSGNIMAGVGYSQVQGIILNASITQDNVFGTGKRINFTFNNSQINTIYRIGYFNPYTNLDGVSSGFDLSYRQTNAQQMNLANYNTDVATAGGNLGVPLGEFDSLRFNLDYNHTKLKTSSNTSEQVYNFIQDNGDTFDYVTLAAGWVHDTLNRAIFPTDGGAQRLSILSTVPAGSLQFYKASYKIQHYFPIAKDLTFMVQAEAAYGDGYNGTDGLPFFENYFAGGPQSVRGFMANTLGPRTTPNPTTGFGGNLPLGGSSKLVGTAELLFPVPFMHDNKSIRLGAFMDAGNVYCGAFKTPNPDDINCYAQSSGNFMRFSTGLSARWLSPFGNLSFSIAEPLNSQPGDRTQLFQFSFGSGF